LFRESFERFIAMSDFDVDVKTLKVRVAEDVVSVTSDISSVRVREEVGRVSVRRVEESSFHEYGTESDRRDSR
jgi:hypothetical protein